MGNPKKKLKVFGTWPDFFNCSFLIFGDLGFFTPVSAPCAPWATPWLTQTDVQVSHPWVKILRLFQKLHFQHPETPEMHDSDVRGAVLWVSPHFRSRANETSRKVVYKINLDRRFRKSHFRIPDTPELYVPDVRDAFFAVFNTRSLVKPAGKWWTN